MDKRPQLRLTVDQYERMIQHGILTENSNVELIRGEIVLKMSKGTAHVSCMKRLAELFYDLTRQIAMSSAQDPIVLADSEPEPDYALLVRQADFYASRKPTAKDVLLLIEVADSSLEYDREIKGPLYAENGIAEYWIVNLIDNCLEVYRDPRPDGTYGDARVLRAGDSISLVRLPTVSVKVDELIS